MKKQRTAEILSNLLSASGTIVKGTSRWALPAPALPRLLSASRWVTLDFAGTYNIPAKTHEDGFSV